MSEPVESPSFLQSLLGPKVTELPFIRAYLAWPLTRQVAVAVATFAALLYLPYLGAVGLWDPWESHYGEVGRMMLQRNNFVVPFWESSPFFSKPPMLMWLDVLGMAVVGTARGSGQVPLYTEWAMRLPTALFSIAALCLLAVSVARAVGKRSGFAVVFVLGTMPLYFLLARGIITDSPFVSAFTCAMACAIVGLFDERTQHRTAWWYGFYFFCGIAVLAKELLGVALPGAIILLYALFCVLPWTTESWSRHFQWLTSAGFRKAVREGQEPMPVLFEQMYKMRLGTGFLVFLGVALPWLLVTVFFAKGRDPEGEDFVYRYFVHDQFGRLTAGVHSTEKDTPFVYFLQHGGYAIFPWVAAVPGALIAAGRNRMRAPDVRAQLSWLALFWTLTSFLVVGISATKFPHYIFPALPGLAILLGLFIEDLWKDGIADHAFGLVMGFVLFVVAAKDLALAPFRDGRDYVGIPTVTGGLKAYTDILEYNHDRPYPVALMSQPLTFFGTRVLPGHIVGIGLILIGLYVFFERTEKAAGAKSNGDALPKVIGAGLLGLGVITLGISKAGADNFASVPSLARAFGTVTIPEMLTLLFQLVGLVLVVSAILKSRTLLFSTFTAFAIFWMAWLSWDHWVDLSHHWTQRDLFWRYYDNRKPNEPIAAYLMDWKGETFYSRNTVVQIKTAPKMTEYLALPGRKWVLVEQGARLRGLQQQASGHAVQVWAPELNAKLAILSID